MTAIYQIAEWNISATIKFNIFDGTNQSKHERQKLAIAAYFFPGRNNRLQ
jgi:hypothetical protein